jgi:hypothetical protein
VVTMRGNGRGYYGAEQLDSRGSRPRTSGLVKLGLVAGVGAVVWLVWPRSKKYDPEFVRYDETVAPPPPSPPLPEPAPPPVDHQLPALPDAFAGLPPLPPPQLTQEAIARGYPSQEAYEDAVVDTARQLQDTGARVTLAPHHQHLARRVGPT